MRLLKIKVLSEKMKDKYLEQISNRDPMDAGFDLLVPDDHVVRKLSTSNCIDHKIQIEYYDWVPASDEEKQTFGSEGIPSFILMPPRSSISKTSLRLANSIGVIDSGYRGNLKAFVDNLGAEKHIKAGTSLFQLIVGENCEIRMVDELSESKRGSGGFGSTGKTLT